MKKLPPYLSFRGTPEELTLFLTERRTEELNDSNLQNTALDPAMKPREIAISDIPPTESVLRPLYTKTLRGMDLADQKWIEKYRTQLRRDGIYQTVGNIVKTPIRLLGRLFGYKEPNPDAYTAGRDVSFHLRPATA